MSTKRNTRTETLHAETSTVPVPKKKEKQFPKYFLKNSLKNQKEKQFPKNSLKNQFPRSPRSPRFPRFPKKLWKKL